jgi:hypothetical protein
MILTNDYKWLDGSIHQLSIDHEASTYETMMHASIGETKVPLQMFAHYEPQYLP